MFALKYSNMALRVQGAITPIISGSIGGTIFSSNRGGDYMKNKVIPLNPATARQTLIRGLTAGFAQSWRGLTDAQRIAWNAATLNFPVTNNVGNTVILSGEQLYIRLNVVLSNIGQPNITTPPLPASISNFQSCGLNAALASMNFTGTYIGGGTSVPAGHSLVIYATAPLSAGIFNFGSRLRQITVFSTGTSTAAANIFPQYVAKFGAGPPTGTRVGLMLQSAVNATGQLGIPITTSDIS